jgi:predicted kinase
MTLILVRGLPGSGKSTYAASLGGYRHLEADMFFERSDGSYHFDPAKLAQAHAWCQGAVRHELRQGADVVVSNTFTQRWEMQPYLDMAQELNVPVKVVVMNGRFKNVHNVPEQAIERMRARWED